MTFNSANLTGERQIAAFPYLVTTIDEAAALFLQGLPTPDFSNDEDTHVDWAIAATGAGDTDESHSGSAFIVSQATYRRLKAHRY